MTTAKTMPVPEPAEADTETEVIAKPAAEAAPDPTAGRAAGSAGTAIAVLPAGEPESSQESARIAGLPHLNLTVSIEAEAAAAADAREGRPQPESPRAKAKRHAAVADAMTAAALALPLDAPLPEHFAVALAENTAGVDEAILAPLWPKWQACHAMTEAQCSALLDEWDAIGWEATIRPLRVWRKTGQRSEPCDRRWMTPDPLAEYVA